MEQWLGDQYAVQGMGSLSGPISKRIGTCNIGVGTLGWGCRGHVTFCSGSNLKITGKKRYI